MCLLLKLLLLSCLKWLLLWRKVKFLSLADEVVVADVAPVAVSETVLAISVLTAAILAAEVAGVT